MKKPKTSGTTPTRSNTVGRVVDAAAAITGKRFCTSHQGEVANDQGSYITKGKATRFICFKCQQLRRKK